MADLSPEIIGAAETQILTLRPQTAQKDHQAAELRVRAAELDLQTAMVRRNAPGMTPEHNGFIGPPGVAGAGDTS